MSKIRGQEVNTLEDLKNFFIEEKTVRPSVENKTVDEIVKVIEEIQQHQITFEDIVEFYRKKIK